MSQPRNRARAQSVIPISPQTTNKIQPVFRRSRASQPRGTRKSVGVTTSQSAPSTTCHTYFASNHEQNPAGIPPSPSDPSCGTRKSPENRSNPGVTQRRVSHETRSNSSTKTLRRRADDTTSADLRGVSLPASGLSVARKPDRDSAGHSPENPGDIAPRGNAPETHSRRIPPVAD